MSSLVIRLVCGLLFSALVLGAVVRPPDNISQGIGMMLPGAMLLSVALKGTRRSVIPKKKREPAPVVVSGESPRV